jgi:flagellar assembly factor FliW
MSYKVHGNILGFETMSEVEIHKVDELFSTMVDKENDNLSFTLVSPYALREYSFDVPLNVKQTLEITNESKLTAYNIVVIQKPLEKSTVNFLAPILVNLDNGKIAQVVLNPKEHPDFGMAESIESFRNE